MAATKSTITIRIEEGHDLLPARNSARPSTVSALKRRSSRKRTLENTPSVRGMIKKVLHLVEVVSETR